MINGVEVIPFAVIVASLNSQLVPNSPTNCEDEAGFFIAIKWASHNATPIPCSN